ncbi:hypothetical protein P43SY_008910 [Pythium insidiosum]|uniref:Uncharacterized protein n=1 Tax=Pythium insidiosum TaxID=114742 RepID=A0AAD5LE72_PYTIN|nr:hypothetical protein P43SY_008910 [Pythium insidiosum]
MADASSGGERRDVLVHSSTVYLYLYDAAQGSYAQQGDTALGCALLATPPAANAAFKLLFYNAQKQPVLQTAVTATAPRFTPQQNNYVNFYDATQRNYSMRFKDAAASAAFLRAVAFTKAQALASSAASYQDPQRGWLAQSDDLELGKDGTAVGAGDVVGLAWTTWQGSNSPAAFTANPMELTQQTPAETVPRDGDLKRLALVDSSNQDPMSRALTDALQGMQRHGRRVIAVVLPAIQQWLIAEVELVKVKKAKTGSVSAPAAAASSSSPAEAEAEEQSHDDLVHRMAVLSRAGSQGSGLIASMTMRPGTHEAHSPSVANPERRQTSFSLKSATMEEAIATPGQVPVPLPGIASELNALLAGRRPSASPSAALEQTPPPAAAPSAPRESLASRVFSPLKAQAANSERQSVAARGASPSSEHATAMSSELERLHKEQSELDELRRQLEESKRRLAEGADDAASNSSTTHVGAPPVTALTIAQPPGPAESLFSSPSALNGFKPWQPSPSPALSMSATSTSSPPFAAFSSSNAVRPGDSVLPSFSSSLSSSLISAPSAWAPPSSLPSRPHSGPTTGSGASPEIESGLMRLQRSSTSIESALQDLQSKMDRLLNMQSSSLKTNKYLSPSTTSGLYGASGGAGASPLGASSSSSSSMLLKNLEKALTQRDQLQDLNARLQESRETMESAIEDLQSQHEALQLENRNLLDKLQSGNHLQQEKFRLELRSVQQQLSHTQEQMLVYQEENFRLRQELAAKDESMQKEKLQIQDDARKQLEQLQRQLQQQVHQESKDTMDKLQSDKFRLEKQVSELHSQKTQLELERDSLATQLRLAQTQQSQWQDEKTQTMAIQDARVQELQAQVQQLSSDATALRQQLERHRADNTLLQDSLLSKEREMTQLQQAKTQQEYAALSELLKEFMNDIYFHFQDAFEEDAEFTGKEIVMAIRKILKQNTMEILAKLEEFWQLQHQQQQPSATSQ